MSIVQANALYIPLADKTVQTCVTSPPYFGLRSYGIGTENGEIGLEETPEQYIEKMVAVFREVWRVLRDDGSLWANIGDSYNGNKKGNTETKKNPRAVTDNFEKKSWAGAKEKDLLGIPWMLAFALRADGWYLRSEIIWHKPNPMPESVTDRPTKSHEQIFLLSKQARYYYDAMAIAEPKAESTKDDTRGNDNGHRRNRDYVGAASNGGTNLGGPDGLRNKRSVWEVATQPYSGAHFATFPEALVEPCILAGTSTKGGCPACGSPWERVVEQEKPEMINRLAPKSRIQGNDSRSASVRKGGDYLNGPEMEKWKAEHPAKISWRPTCECNAGEPVPQLVLDPFSGSGVTGRVAIRNRRRYFGIELNREYIQLSKKRTTTDVLLF